MKAQTAAVIGVGAAGTLAAIVAALAASGARRAGGALLGSLDEEAIARMLASEKAAASPALWRELIWTQIRAMGGQSLYRQMTGGIGYGPQGGARPVSTAQPPTARTRAFAAQFLATLPASGLPGARRMFEPLEQDRLFVVGERARRKRKAGEPLTPQEERAIHYKSDAADIRRRWTKKGHRYVDTLEGFEFWT